MNWLLTGGAGYIGSHIAWAMRDTGRPVVVLDDLSTGSTERLPPDIPVVEASILDGPTLTKTLREIDIEGVIHLAAKKSVTESMASPHLYYTQNVLGLHQLLTCMHDASVQRLVFSSSASVYGDAPDSVVEEDSPTVPVSPYGWTKLAGEDTIRLVGEVTRLRSVILRYFNVAGAGSPELGDTGCSNVLPLTFRALQEGSRPPVYGTDYPTPDGSCVRDYIHVADLAEAHVAAATLLESGRERISRTYNVGWGTGASVLELFRAVGRATGRTVEPAPAPRRPGDTATVVAKAGLIAEELGWRSTRDLGDIVRTAWASWCYDAASRR